MLKSFALVWHSEQLLPSAAGSGMWLAGSVSTAPVNVVVEK
jgi:hypothetical protein